MNMVKLCGGMLIDIDRVVVVSEGIALLSTGGKINLTEAQTADLADQYERLSDRYLDAAIGLAVGKR